MMGPTDAMPMIPSESSFVLCIENVVAMPMPSARMNGTDTSPVVAPLLSKASATNSCGANMTSAKTSAYKTANVVLMLMFFAIRTSAAATPMPMPVAVIHMNSVLLTSGMMMLICRASTASAGSATVARRPNVKPNASINAMLLYFENDAPTMRPIGRMLESRPTKKSDWPITTDAYPITMRT